MAELYARLNSRNNQRAADKPTGHPTQVNAVEPHNAQKIREQASAPPPIPTRPDLRHDSHAVDRRSTMLPGMLKFHVTRYAND